MGDLKGMKMACLPAGTDADVEMPVGDVAIVVDIVVATVCLVNAAAGYGSKTSKTAGLGVTSREAARAKSRRQMARMGEGRLGWCRVDGKLTGWK